jgi:Kef-type K+ transport system membrane component KefB
MSPVDARVEVVLLQILLQLGLIITVARLCGAAFRAVGQPQVCGEIAAGLLLGPSVFGKLFPGAAAALFDPTAVPALTILSQIGLILLMFLIGLEFDFGHLRTSGRAAGSISLAGIAVPFTLGILSASVLYPYVGEGVNRTGFTLFIATSLSITALPILGRMLVEFNLQRTRLGCLVIGAAALDDAAGWTLLALVTALVRSEFSVGATLGMMAATAAFAAFMILVARPLLARWASGVTARHGRDIPLGALAVVLVAVLLSAAVTNVIGLFSIFGGFILGAILYDQHELKEALLARLRDFVTVFFLPVFFTFTGLRTDIGTMHGAVAWALCGLVLVAAIAGKAGGCYVAARLSGFGRSEAAAVGILMNTRALMELVVVNIGYEIGVIPQNVFFMLVLMAVTTTYMTTPLLRRALRHTELAHAFEASAFARRAQPSAAAA